jgi:hypothetical protein
MMKQPINNFTASADSPWNSQSPTAMPAGTSSAKRQIRCQAMCRRNSQVRQTLDASWTTPCTGMAATGGMNCSISAIKIVPPPEPTTAVIAEVKKAAQPRTTMSTVVMRGKALRAGLHQTVGRA